ncbi:unnamed protein product [Ceutorhynchus assimilis]|uniref:Uncharacterized protein n=1 Tax=Ceutorhynchus assimilis TaxID=467358 RepID=A0A9N9QCW6_9CUCU|nr:unnamed protein product [Ceutorhynchus assimilis]
MIFLPSSLRAKSFKIFPFFRGICGVFGEVCGGVFGGICDRVCGGICRNFEELCVKNSPLRNCLHQF